MYNSDKVIGFDDFMAELYQRIRNLNNSSALIFFESFLLNNFPAKFRLRVRSGWDGTVNVGDFDIAYPMAANILHDAATRNASEHNNKEIYQNASTISKVMCDLINELFECSGDDLFQFLKIKSYSEMMVEAGMVIISTDSNGQEVVSLTEQGKRAAQEFEGGGQDSFAV